MKKFSTLSFAILLSLGLHAAQAQTPVGEVKGTATAHTEASAKGVMAGAQLVLPAQATGGAAYVGAFKDAPATVRNKVPVVVFLHGSSGLGLKAIGEWQQWLGSLGIASVAPDSFALPDRVTYKSPASKEAYAPVGDHPGTADLADPALGGHAASGARRHQRGRDGRGTLWRRRVCGPHHLFVEL